MVGSFHTHIVGSAFAHASECDGIILSRVAFPSVLCSSVSLHVSSLTMALLPPHHVAFVASVRTLDIRFRFSCVFRLPAGHVMYSTTPTKQRFSDWKIFFSPSRNSYSLHLDVVHSAYCQSMMHTFAWRHPLACDITTLVLRTSTLSHRCLMLDSSVQRPKISSRTGYTSCCISTLVFLTWPPSHYPANPQFQQIKVTTIQLVLQASAVEYSTPKSSRTAKALNPHRGKAWNQEWSFRWLNKPFSKAVLGAPLTPPPQIGVRASVFKSVEDPRRVSLNFEIVQVNN